MNSCSFTKMLVATSKYFIIIAVNIIYVKYLDTLYINYNEVVVAYVYIEVEKEVIKL